VRIPTPSFVFRSLARPGEDRSIEAQAVRQALAGLFATAADLGTFRLGLALLLHPMACATASFAVGTTVNFFLTRHYVIGEPARQKRSLPVQYLTYVATGLVSLAIVQILLLVFHLLLGFQPFHVKLASVPVVFVWTVLSSRFLVFVKRPPGGGGWPGTRTAPLPGASALSRSHFMPEDASPAGADPAGPGAARGNSPGKWPKKVPVLTPEQEAIRDDFMRAHLEAMETRWYGFVGKFDNRYPLKTFFPGCRTLEIGAGLGEHLNWEDRGKQEYHAIELRQELCDRIRERFPGVHAWTGDCQERLDFADGYFDRIIAIHVLEHLPDLPRALREFDRLLKPSGRVSVVIPCEGAWAHRLARNISERPHFERKYKQPYDWFIQAEHLSRPREIMEELKLVFDVRDTRFYPLLVPVINFNLTIGLTLAKKKGGGDDVQ
jgi:SAM-dependent methyltransferase/putative flippase GtrA